MNTTASELTHRLPWWTWVAPLLLCHLGTQVSLWSNVTTGSSLFYFPLPIGLILCCWWGPRIVPAYYLNAVLSASLWGLDDPWLYPLYALPEALFLIMSWLFFVRMSKGKCWLPNVRELLYFLFFGIILPLVLYKLLLELLFMINGEIPREQFWSIAIGTALGDFISLFGVTVPVLYFASGRMQASGLTLNKLSVPSRLNRLKQKLKKRAPRVELGLLVLSVIVSSVLLDFEDYWFIFGTFSLLTAIRFGFGFIVLMNSFILLVTYVIPAATRSEFMEIMILGRDMGRVQIGSSLLYVFSAITGRVMSDAAYYERQLRDQKTELEVTNRELDRFVYSVSHDLSAPLKSIMGLISISRMEPMSPQMHEYVNHIEMSVNKLDLFIGEILDYSRNERLPLAIEVIDVRALTEEILENLKFSPRFDEIRVDSSGLSEQPLATDRMRLKIVLTNLLSNAIKFQRFDPLEPAYIRIRSMADEKGYALVVEDNGEGIKYEHQLRIFDMFFRASTTSKGSGLGLYIVKEVVERLGGEVSVHSERGKGSSFSIRIPAPK